jgi:peptidoglycan/xylan/chitin deacetylase (PgdA/CDA1 family)
MKPGLSILRTVAAAAALSLCAIATAAPGGVNAGACKGTVYLTFDTGSMSQAQLIADTLRRHRIHATFFLANEKTIHGDSTLDDGWAPYWKSLAADGHAFGTHTFDHAYYKGEAGAGKVRFRPQFGEQGGRSVVWGEPEFCAELKRSAERFKAMTGQPMDPLWRAPGGHLSATTERWAQQCGFAHVAWAPAGFLGDELPSERYSNAALLDKALASLRDGDITMAHLGIWSRKDPWAPADLEPLITGLERKGFCFATLRDHPQYKAWFAAHPAAR